MKIQDLLAEIKRLSKLNNEDLDAATASLSDNDLDDLRICCQVLGAAAGSAFAQRPVEDFDATKKGNG